MAFRLALLVVALLALPPVALADSGGAIPGAPGDSGGLRPGDRGAKKVAAHRRQVRQRRAAPVLTSFGLASDKLFQYGGATRVSFRVDGRARTVNVRLYVVPAAGGKAVETLELGAISTRTAHTAELDPDTLTPGRYRLRISARDRRGRALRRARSSAGAVAEFGVYGHRLPLVGEFSYGGEGSRFGAKRDGHTHQGQDLAAAEGTPVVAPHGGTVSTVDFQARGAGHYVVVAARDGRAYVFMHLRAGSILVKEKQSVGTGQQIAEVGNTGSSSGAHLHFEIWEGTWQGGGHPIDPLPYLKSWDRYS